jgi:hypothetical protein
MEIQTGGRYLHRSTQRRELPIGVSSLQVSSSNRTNEITINALNTDTPKLEGVHDVFWSPCVGLWDLLCQNYIQEWLMRETILTTRQIHSTA